jgi:glycosyltransferase involved in cell wall biosynthesis
MHELFPQDKKPTIILFLPSTEKDKQLELLVKNSNFDFIFFAIESNSKSLVDFCGLEGIELFTYPGTKNVFGMFWNLIKISRLIYQFSPKIIESHSILPGLYIALFKLLTRFTGIKFKTVNFRHHNLNHHIQYNFKAIKIDRFISMLHDMNAVPSNSTLATMIAEGCRKEKIKVIPHQLDQDRIREAIKSSPLKLSNSTKQFELIAVGRFDWQKNYELMFCALRRFKDKTNNFRVNIYGSGSSQSKNLLDNAIRKFDLTDFVRVNPWTPNIEIEILKSDLLIHTAADESFGLVLAESIALGIPVVSNWMGGARDLVYFSSLPPSENTCSGVFELLEVAFCDLERVSAQSLIRREEFLKYLNSTPVESLHADLFDN